MVDISLLCTQSLLYVSFFAYISSGEITSIIVPSELSKWTAGHEESVRFYYTESTWGTTERGPSSYEIHLMAGRSNNLQIVDILDDSVSPNATKINTVKVAVPEDVAPGNYTIRIGSMTVGDWVYSPVFPIRRAVKESIPLTKNGNAPLMTSDRSDAGSTEVSESLSGEGTSAELSSDTESASGHCFAQWSWPKLLLLGVFALWSGYNLHH